MQKNNKMITREDAKCPLAGAIFFAIELPIITIITAFFIEKLPLKCYITKEGVSTVKSKNEQYQKFKF